MVKRSRWHWLAFTTAWIVASVIGSAPLIWPSVVVSPVTLVMSISPYGFIVAAIGTATWLAPCQYIVLPPNYPAIYFSQVSEVKGMIPLVTILSGQAITSNDVVKASQALGSQSQYLPIPSGYVALTIPTSEQQGVADYIQPDDYISVIATVQLGGKVASKTIFTNLHVIRVGTNGSAAASGAVTSLTVVVTQCQAEIITWFLSYAALKYSLESYQDYLQSGGQTKDPSCPSVNSAQGVTLQTIQKAYPTLF
jgi:Flp pilus assembly protein CpaB